MVMKSEGRNEEEAAGDANPDHLRAEVPGDGPQRPEQKPSSRPVRPLQQKQVSEMTFFVPCLKT